MGDTRQSLGFDASSAISTIAKVAQALAAYNTSIKNAAAATNSYNRTGASFDAVITSQAKAIDGFKRSVTSATTQLAKLSQTQSGIQSRIKAVGDEAKRQADALRAQAQQAANLQNVAKAHDLNKRAIELESVALKKQILLEQQLQRAKEAASRIRRDPKGIQPVKGQAGIEATVQKIAAQQKATAVQQAKIRADAKKTEAALRAAFRSSGDEADKAGKKGTAAGKSLLLSWQSVIRIFAIQTIHTAIARISSAFRTAVVDAREFEISMAEIQTISGTSFTNFEDLANSLQSISNEFGQQSSVIAEGLYQTLSNQVGDASEALGFLNTASRFATAAVTDTGSAVNLLSSVINAFGLSASDAENVAGKLFKTIELGRLRAGEIADTFGRIAVLSDQLGVSLDETLAAMATLTVQGLRYNEAFTLIQNTQLKLLRPTKALKESFRSLGVTSAEAGIQAFGFQGFLEKLESTTTGTASEMAELFGRVRAIRGVLGLTGQAAERFKDNLEAIGNAGGQTLQEATEKVFATEAKQFEIELTKVKNAFLNAGRTIIETLNDVASVFGGFIQTGSTVFAALVAAALGYVAVVAGPALAATVALNVAILGEILVVNGLAAAMTAAGAASLTALATPLGAAIALGVAVVAISAAWALVTKNSEEAAKSQAEAIDLNTKNAKDAENARRRAVEVTERAILATLQKGFAERQKLYQADARNAELLQKAIFNGLGDQIAERLGVFDSFVSRLGDAAQETTDKIKDLKLSLADARGEAEQFRFDQTLSNLDPIQKTFKQIERSTELIRKSREAFAAGDIKLADSLQKQAEAQAKGALSTADGAKNATTRFRAVESVNEAQALGIKQLEDQIKQQELLRQESERLRPVEEARNSRLKIALERFKQFQLISNGEVDGKDQDGNKISVEVARDRLALLSKSIQEELEEGAKAADILSSLDPEFKKVRDALIQTFTDPVSGQQFGSLENLVDISLERIVGILKNQASQLTSSQKLKLSDLTGINLDDENQAIKGFGPTQGALTQLTESQKAAAKATDEVLTQQGLFKQALLESDEAAKKVVLTLSDLGAGPESFKLSLQIVQLKDDIAAIAAQDLITPEQALSATEKINRLREMAIRASQEGFPELGQQISDIAEGLKTAVDTKIAIDVPKESADTLQVLEKRIKNAKDLFEQANVETGEGLSAASQKGADAYTSQSQRIIQAAKDETEAFKARNAEAAKGPGGGGASASANQFGGGLFRQSGGAIFRKMLKRASGGSAFSLGTDNVLASLTRGESVNTVASTRKFFPQIQAMNSGIQPITRRDGGTTTTVGDININITEASTPRETSREVMQKINRQIRRGTFNLRGK